jgi:hypothetical protein
LMDDGNFLQELDKIGTGPAPMEAPQRRGFWAAQERASADDDLVDMADLPAPSNAERVLFDADEASEEGDVDAETVPTYLAALVILLCTCVGAGGAVVALHDRVQQIVAAWTFAAR